MIPAKITFKTTLLLVGVCFIGGATAKPTYTLLDAGTTATGINDAGFVTGAGYQGNFIRSPDGTVTNFSIEGFGGYGGEINASNVVVGIYGYNGNGAYGGYIRQPDGTITVFLAPNSGLLGQQGTFPESINSAGTITGHFVDTENQIHGFVRTAKGKYLEFDIPNFFGTSPHSINDAGTIAGNCYSADGTSHGFVRASDGGVTIFDVPGAVSGTSAAWINRFGRITGSYGGAGGGTGFIRETDGTFTLLSETVVPDVIDDKGDVAGLFYQRAGNGQYDEFGFFRSVEGSFKTFKVQGEKKRTIISGINASGDVVGTVTVKTGKTYTSYGYIRAR